MKPDLVIITRQFPYGNNETFLESEIPVLSDFFNKITIYPSTSHDTIRQLPSNVFVNNLICKDYTDKIKWGLRTIFSVYFFRSFFKKNHLITNKKKAKAFIKYLISYTIYKNKMNSILSANSGILIYSYWYTAFVDAFCDLKKNGNKIVTRVHRGDLYEEFTELGFFPNRDLQIFKINRIFSISKHGQDYLQNKFNINNVCVSKLGVLDKQLISKCSSSQSFSIVSVSNIIPIKNVPLIAKSIRIFAAEHPNISITWSHFGDGVEISEVRDIILSKSIENLKCILRGRVDNSEILKYYSNYPVDLFINLSSSEGIPVSIMEAISFGIPIIATNVGGTSEIVNEVTGILLSNNLGEEYIGNEIGEIFKFPRNRKNIRDYWINNYSAQNNYEKFAKELIEQY